MDLDWSSDIVIPSLHSELYNLVKICMENIVVLKFILRDLYLGPYERSTVRTERNSGI